jgi:hypothetical protein
LREKQFVEAIEKYINENVRVTDQQESVLAGVPIFGKQGDKEISYHFFVIRDKYPVRTHILSSPHCVFTINVGSWSGSSMK